VSALSALRGRRRGENGRGWTDWEARDAFCLPSPSPEPSCPWALPFRSGSSPGLKAKDNENALVEKIIGFLNSNKGDAEKGEYGIIEKKAHYISRGCRGDWPELMPPEWMPEK
jgi:hypothetical protein